MPQGHQYILHVYKKRKSEQRASWTDSVCELVAVVLRRGSARGRSSTKDEDQTDLDEMLLKD